MRKFLLEVGAQELRKQRGSLEFVATSVHQIERKGEQKRNGEGRREREKEREKQSSSLP